MLERLRGRRSRQGYAVALFLIAGTTLSLVVGMSSAEGATASVAVTSVGGQPVTDGTIAKPVSGAVDVRGTATLGTPPARPGPAPLVADAGDSAFVRAGDRAALLGAGYGGTEPYRFAWSSSHGKLTGADAATAELDTTGLAAGTYAVSLKVTDAAGATATDSVRVVVYQAQTLTVLDETRTDPTPGVGGTDSLEFAFDVPAGTERIDVRVSWTVPANDYDLRVLGPDGGQQAASAGAPPSTEEVTGVDRPAAGRWKAMVDKFATSADSVRVVVTATKGVRDPRPVVDSGGPYRFGLDATQKLTGSVTGGTAPVRVGWDTDDDGVVDSTGTTVTLDLPEGRHLVTFKATDAYGLERRETTSVLVADADRLAEVTTAVTVVAIADTGINPYHLEFSAQAYPDPDVLELTRNFTRHPSEYIPGYPAEATALPVTLGRGYFPAADAKLWTTERIKAGQLYWLPGTKIVGAVDAGGSTGTTSGDDPRPILDDNGHGSGSASVSVGNRYGYCPTCLLVAVEALDETVAAKYPWVDISSNSFGYLGGLPLGPVVGANTATRAAAERGQTTLFAAGNGVGNAFDVPVNTYLSDQTGNDWNITVGAIRRDNQRAIVGDGIPVHISAWGDGNLPSACGTGTVGQCAFGGTSAATPYTAGVFGTVLTRTREAVGDGRAGQKPGQVVADGVAVADSVFLADGKLTRAELREAVLKTAFPLNQDNKVSPFPYPLTAPYVGDGNVLFEGYGAATPESAKRAIDVLLGREVMPERSFEDQFFALDRSVRDTLYGGYDRDGDGDRDSEAIAGLELFPGGDEANASTAGALSALRAVAARKAATEPATAGATVPTGQNALTYYLHRRYTGAPGTTAACAATGNEQYMNRQNSTGDLEPCFESRVTSVVAGYRPLGIFAGEDTLEAPLPAGSDVYATLYLASETPAMVRPTGVLVATDREIGTGPGALAPIVGSGPAGAACTTLGELCWTKYDLSFKTTRPAFTGEHLTFQVQMVGARSWAFGFEGTHTSKVAIVAAPLPPTGLDFGATVDSPAAGSSVPETEKVVAGGRVTFPDLGSDPTGAGDHPTERAVEVSLDDPSFDKPRQADLDAESGTWSLDLGELDRGEHTVYVRARIDRTYSKVASSAFRVLPQARVEWQVVPRNAAPDPDGWGRAEGLESWSFRFDTADEAKGRATIVVRLVDKEAETARTSVRIRIT